MSLNVIIELLLSVLQTNWMFQTKLQYLYRQNSLLKKSISQLNNIINCKSEQNVKSVIYQLQQENEKLRQVIFKLNDEILFQKQARQIENTIHQQQVEQYNAAMFALKKQIKSFQNIFKQQTKVRIEEGILQKWVKQKIFNEKNQIFHKYSDPLILFDILTELLGYIEKRSYQYDSKDDATQNVLFTQIEEGKKLHSNINQSLNHQSKWFEEESEVYFLQKKRKQNLRLKLGKAKLIQLCTMKMQNNGKQALTENPKLLKQSYITLIAEYQLLRKKILFYEKYIGQLENRNQILINSHLQAVL